jgi:hypothetical protein
MLEAAACCLDYSFLCWPLRKVYAEALDVNLEQFSSGIDRYFVVEGIRRGHTYAGGQFRDLVELAIYRDHWLALRQGKHLPSAAPDHAVAQAGETPLTAAGS